MCVSLVAHQEGVSANLLFTWPGSNGKERWLLWAQAKRLCLHQNWLRPVVEIGKRQRVLGKKSLENEILKEAVEIAVAKKWIAHSPLLTADDQ